jgi:vacuolar-type H+-ATPase subunit E/Vma4
MRINHSKRGLSRITQNREYRTTVKTRDPMKYKIFIYPKVIKKTEDDIKCYGGVLLTSDDGLIICKNTLDVRTDICFQESLPDIRRIMFT